MLPTAVKVSRNISHVNFFRSNRKLYYSDVIFNRMCTCTLSLSARSVVFERYHFEKIQIHIFVLCTINFF